MTSITNEKMQAVIEAAIMVAGHPLTVSAMQNLFPENAVPSPSDIQAALSALTERYQQELYGIELQQTASGYRFQAKTGLSPWLARLWEERAPRYSRAFLETLAIIAYKQPITRAEIEEIRGVTVSSHIVKTLQDRDWIRVIGYREIPGRPGIYGTTKEFLDYFNLKSLAELPTLAELKNFEAEEAKLQVQLALDESNIGPMDSEKIPGESAALIAEDGQPVENADQDNTVVIETSETITDEDTGHSIEVHETMIADSDNNVVDIIETTEEVAFDDETENEAQDDAEEIETDEGDDELAKASS